MCVPRIVMKISHLIILCIIALKLRSASGMGFNLPCNSNLDCGGHMRCVKAEGIHVCRCRFGIQIYDRDRQECVNLINSVCKIHAGPRCEVGSTCREKSPGAFVCLPTTPEPTMVIFNSPCESDQDCESTKTYLKCSKAMKKCTCKPIDEFDHAKNQCVKKIGGHCVPKGGGDVQSCVSHGICRPLLNQQGQFRSDGKCCLKNDPSDCSEFPSAVTKPPNTGPLPGTLCSKLDDCDPETTFLKCLSQNNSSICSCGRNNRFNPDSRQCLLGLGMACYHTPSYRNPSPQQCVPEASCKNLGGTSGKCECVSEAQCDHFQQPHPVLPPGGHPYRGSASLQSWISSFQLFSLILFLITTNAVIL